MEVDESALYKLSRKRRVRGDACKARSVSYSNIERERNVLCKVDNKGGKEIPHSSESLKSKGLRAPEGKFRQFQKLSGPLKLYAKSNFIMLRETFREI